MSFVEDFFVIYMVCLVLSCIIVKLVSAGVSKDGRVDKEKVVVEEAKITKGLVVSSRKSKKRVKFVEQEVVGNVDHVETQEPNEDDVEGFVEKRIEGILKKGDGFRGEEVEREVCDVHDVADMCGKIGLLEDNEVTKIEKRIEGILKKGDDFKGEKVSDNLYLIEQCGSDVDEYADMASLIELLEGNEVEKFEKKIECILKKDDEFKGEKVSDTIDLIEQCGGGERKVSGVHDDPEMCSKIVLMEEKVEVKKIEDILKKGDDFKGEKVFENLDLIEHCGGEREVSDVHTSSEIGLMEEKDEVKKIDELLVVKEKDIANALVADEVKVGENEVVEVGFGLNKEDDEKTNKMVMDEYSDDDWEGIERSELEEEFVKAVNFVDGGNGKNSCMENMGSELMMKLYGLQKIAIDGPCHEPQPMALKIYARAKWNAWQKMGSMNPEEAMERYIKLLSDHAPKWTHHNKDACEVSSSETKITGEPDSVPDSLNDTHKDERTREMNHAADGGDFSGGEKEQE